jgi:hypothetical protein
VLALVPVLIQEQERKMLRRKNVFSFALAAVLVVLSSVAAVALWRVQ